MATAAEKRAAREAAQHQAAERAPAVAAANAAAAQDPGSVRSADVIKPQSAGGKVTVACKLGIGWFDLQIYQPKKVQENTQTGPREITQFFPVPGVVRIRGTAYPRGTPPEGFPARPEMVGGYALTRGVDEHFWDTWVEQQKKSPYVLNKMIFAYERESDVKGLALDHKDAMSGLEPLNPKKDPRAPKSTNKSVTDVETEESRAAKMGQQA